MGGFVSRCSITLIVFKSPVFLSAISDILLFTSVSTCSKLKGLCSFVCSLGFKTSMILWTIHEPSLLDFHAFIPSVDANISNISLQIPNSVVSSGVGRVPVLGGPTTTTCVHSVNHIFAWTKCWLSFKVQFCGRLYLRLLSWCYCMNKKVYGIYTRWHNTSCTVQYNYILLASQPKQI